jgi:hypothetical protein
MATPEQLIVSQAKAEGDQIMIDNKEPGLLDHMIAGGMAAMTSVEMLDWARKKHRERGQRKAEKEARGSLDQYKMESEVEDLAEDLPIEEVSLPELKPWELPAGQKEWQERKSYEERIAGTYEGTKLGTQAMEQFQVGAYLEGTNNVRIGENGMMTTTFAESTGVRLPSPETFNLNDQAHNDLIQQRNIQDIRAGNEWMGGASQSSLNTTTNQSNLDYLGLGTEWKAPTSSSWSDNEGEK